MAGEHCGVALHQRGPADNLCTASAGIDRGRRREVLFMAVTHALIRS